MAPVGRNAIPMPPDAYGSKYRNRKLLALNRSQIPNCENPLGAPRPEVPSERSRLSDCPKSSNLPHFASVSKTHTASTSTSVTFIKDVGQGAWPGSQKTLGCSRLRPAGIEFQRNGAHTFPRYFTVGAGASLGSCLAAVSESVSGTSL